jgi:hypothetical protein
VNSVQSTVFGPEWEGQMASEMSVQEMVAVVCSKPLLPLWTDPAWNPRPLAIVSANDHLVDAPDTLDGWLQQLAAEVAPHALDDDEPPVLAGRRRDVRRSSWCPAEIRAVLRRDGYEERSVTTPSECPGEMDPQATSVEDAPEDDLLGRLTASDIYAPEVQDAHLARAVLGSDC